MKSYLPVPFIFLVWTTCIFWLPSLCLLNWGSCAPKMISCFGVSLRDDSPRRCLRPVDIWFWEKGWWLGSVPGSLWKNVLGRIEFLNVLNRRYWAWWNPSSIECLRCNWLGSIPLHLLALFCFCTKAIGCDIALVVNSYGLDLAL